MDQIDWKTELEKRLALMEGMSYRARIASLPNCKHIDRRAWSKALEGFDINEICTKHEEWVRQQFRGTDSADDERK